MSVLSSDWHDKAELRSDSLVMMCFGSAAEYALYVAWSFYRREQLTDDQQKMRRFTRKNVPSSRKART